MPQAAQALARVAVTPHRRAAQFLHWATCHLARASHLSDLIIVLLLALAIRLVNLRQPLLENFVDRQVHTAMMARNLARGGSPFYPEIDVGPFPAYYMLEFPGYPAVVAALSGVLHIELDVAGRLFSALATAVACAALFGLVHPRDGRMVAWLAAMTLAVMPVAVRYGRAFQPDATMLGLLVAGVWAMDRWAERDRTVYLFAAALATSLALLLKVIAAYILLPLAYLAWNRCGRSTPRRWELWVALALCVVPSALWYGHAYAVAAGITTVSTPFWHLDKWLAPAVLLREATYRELAYYVGLRVLTPIGAALAVGGVLVRAQGKRALLFHVWLASLATYAPVLLRKLDHEHYYLALAPVSAVFIARALGAVFHAPLSDRLYVGGRPAAAALALALLSCNFLACRSTFRTPAEWSHVTEAAQAARQCTPPGALVASHSSVLFYADRRGFATVYAPHEIQYSFRTWGQTTSYANPVELLEFYRHHGADYLVELLGTGRELDNPGFFGYIRQRYQVVREVPGKYLVIALGRKNGRHDMPLSN